MSALGVIGASWAAWAISWTLAAVWSYAPAKRARAGAQFFYYAIVGVGGSMLFAGAQRAGFTAADAEISPAIEWACAALTIAGFVFAWWARLHLGPLWSANVGRKAEHKVVDTGPYALVRHPIYTGLILSGFATGAATGSPRAILGAAIMALGWWVKARLEEDFLSAELGADEYQAYRARVPMLIPFFPF